MFLRAIPPEDGGGPRPAEGSTSKHEERSVSAGRGPSESRALDEDEQVSARLAHDELPRAVRRLVARDDDRLSFERALHGIDVIHREMKRGRVCRSRGSTVGMSMVKLARVCSMTCTGP